MELLHELVLSALFAVFLSFLISKLVSMAMAGGGCSSYSPVSSSRNVHQEIVEDASQDLHFSERLQVGEFEGEKRVEFVAEEAHFVDHFLERSFEVEENEKSVNSHEVIEAECCELPTKSVEELSEGDNDFSEVISGNDVDKFQLNKVFGANFPDDHRAMKQQPEEVIHEKEIGDYDNLLEEKVKIGMELSVGKDIIGESEEIQAEAQKKIEIDSDDDDWEGIERSELENIFAKATKFMEKEDLANAGSDVQMELYGLHKIATEGPCREQGPMPLKVAARAKCDGEHCFRCARNAWQRLGNMNPDVAMEQYVALVSNKIPNWNEDKFIGDGKLEPLEVENIGAMASDTSMSSDNHLDYTEQRKNAEDKPSTAEKYLTGGPILESLVEE